MPFNIAGMKQLANLTSYDFTKDPADEEKSKAVAEKNVNKTWREKLFG
jgi:arabinogalactan endo-1,4-beta-galactosidase